VIAAEADVGGAGVTPESDCVAVSEGAVTEGAVTDT